MEGRVKAGQDRFRLFKFALPSPYDQFVLLSLHQYIKPILHYRRKTSY